MLTRKHGLENLSTITDWSNAISEIEETDIALYAAAWNDSLPNNPDVALRVFQQAIHNGSHIHISSNIELHATNWIIRTFTNSLGICLSQAVGQ